MRSSFFAIVIVIGAGLAACSASSSATSDAAATTDGPHHSDGTSSDGTMSVDDGTPMRLPCTSSFGTALSTLYGRLDGYLVAIVAPGAGNCHGDTDHIHLQIQVNSMIYDVAVNVGTTTQDVHTATRELSFPAWSEGWHTGVTEDYVALGVHSTDIPLESSTQIATDVDGDLATANHISIFATGYGSGGVHLVHHRGGGQDGLIVTKPLSTPSHARLFSFTNQTF
jgi:hypothetical protein